MILLVGATGRLGNAVAERLLRDGVPFRAACRSLAKAKALTSRGVQVVEFDLASGTGLPRAVAGASKIVSCVHGLLGSSRASIDKIDVQGHAALIKAAADENAQKFVFISTLGASLDHPAEFWRAKAATETHLRTSGLPHVILRASAFMDLYAHELIGAAVLKNKPVFLLGSGNSARDMIAVDDVADAVVTALTRVDIANETIEIGSGESLTDREVAAMYARLSGQKAKVFAVSPFMLRTLGAAISPFHAGIGRLMRLPGQLASRSDAHLSSTSGNERLGIHPVRLEDFVKQHLQLAREIRAASRAR